MSFELASLKPKNPQYTAIGLDVFKGEFNKKIEKGIRKLELGMNKIIGKNEFKGNSKNIEAKRKKINCIEKE